jgi:hypothetical protein
MFRAFLLSWENPLQCPPKILCTTFQETELLKNYQIQCQYSFLQERNVVILGWINMDWIPDPFVLWRIWWYTPLKWRVLVRMIGFISSYTFTLSYTQYCSTALSLSYTIYSPPLHTHWDFSVSTSPFPATDLNTQTIKVLLNHTLQMLLHYSTYKVFTSQFMSSQDDCS